MKHLNNNVYYRFMEKRSLYKDITIFRSRHNSRNVYLTSPLKNQSGNVMIASLNDNITKEILEEHGSECLPDVQPLFVVKYIAENLRLPLAIILNSYCILDTKEQKYEVYYTASQLQHPVEKYREVLGSIDLIEFGI